MVLLYCIILFINIFEQTQIYGSKVGGFDLDKRFWRNIDTIGKSKDHHLLTNTVNDYKREKRQLTFSLKGNHDKQAYSTPKYIYRTNSNLSKDKINWKLNNQSNRLTNNNNSIHDWRENYWRNIGKNDTIERSNNTANYNRVNNTVFYTYPYKVPVINTSYEMPRFNYSRRYPTETLMPKFNTTGFGSRRRYPVFNYSERNNQTETEPTKPIYSYRDPSKNNNNNEYFWQGLPNNSNLTDYNYYNITIKPYAPGYLPIPEFDGSKGSDTSNHWYNNLNYGRDIKDNDTVTATTENILSGCTICRTGCSFGRHRSGKFCVRDQYGY